MADASEFVRARDVLLNAPDYESAYRSFQWPRLSHFNWAIDWFDARFGSVKRPALRIVADDGTVIERTFAELSETSTRVANSLRAWGVRRGDRILLMLGNELALWETFLAAMKLGAVVVPATTQLTARDIEDRFTRGGVKHVVVGSEAVERFAGIPGEYTRIVAGEARDGFRSIEDAHAGSTELVPDAETRASDPLLLYFTSGTTARPKLVLHTHESYPIGHLSTMYWIGVREGDVHLNISSPGWAKHAWSSFFAPWNAGATVLALDHRRFDAKRTRDAFHEHRVDTLCAPPTVWRMMILEDLGTRPEALREIVSAGEPLNPEVIDRVQKAWGITIRDGFGQTESSAQIGNPPGRAIVPGAMGVPLPGFEIDLLDHEGNPAKEGEVALKLEPRPVGLMVGYVDDDERTRAMMADGHYRTGDEAIRDENGVFTFVARGDDVFKSSDYRISPFELESALLEHASVAEAAVVPSPDPVRLAVPKAFVTLKPGVEPSAETARSIFAFVRERLAPYKRVRRLEFSILPKTISGKIRRVELRALEKQRREEGGRAEHEFFVED